MALLIDNRQGKVVWFTGLSGAGKTTLALALKEELSERGVLCRVLDGDDVRSGLNSDLGFSPEDRHENIRRVAEVARLFADVGVVTIVALITPTNSLRDVARQIVGGDRMLEVYLSTPLNVCISRDAKGLYAKALRGEIENFTGISAPFEVPNHYALTIDTSQVSVERAVRELINMIEGV